MESDLKSFISSSYLRVKIYVCTYANPKFFFSFSSLRFSIITREISFHHLVCSLSNRWMEEEKIFIIEMYSIFIFGKLLVLTGAAIIAGESAKNDLCIKHLSIYFSDFLLGAQHISVCQHPRKIILFLPVSCHHMEEFCVLLIMTMRGYEV